MKKLEPRKLPSSPPPAAAAAKRLVLYVEDEEANREVTELRLGSEFDFVWAADAREACALVHRYKDDLYAILMDIQLKGSELDGIELTRLFRGEKLPNAPTYAADLPVLDVPILFVTAYGKRYAEGHLLARGGTQLIDKPVDFVGLALTLAHSRARKTSPRRIPPRPVTAAETVRDAETGFFNAKHLAATLQAAIPENERLGLLLVQIDRLGDAPAVEGAPVTTGGDKPLRQLAGIVLADSPSVRARGRLLDVPCRFGDETLAIVMPGADRQALFERAEAVRSMVEPFHFTGGARFTVSLGAAFFPDHASTKEDLIRAATEALESAQRAGGNRVEIAR